MLEHVHEWSVDHQIIETDDGPPQPRGECFAYCGCSEELRMDDIRRRLNATERLNAEDARETADDIHGDWWPLEGTSPYEDALRDYAAALEEE